MSVTTSFRHPRNFPFVINNTVPTGYNYYGGLTLQQVKDVWWNLEQIEITALGVYVDSDLGFTLLVPNADASIPLECSSFVAGEADATPPRSRVCVTSNRSVSLFQDTAEIGFPDRDFILEILVIVDPDDSDLYAVAYKFRVGTSADTDQGALIMNPANTDVSFSGTPDFSGSLSFGPVFFDWIGGGYDPSTLTWQAGGSEFGINMSPLYFTYPL